LVSKTFLLRGLT